MVAIHDCMELNGDFCQLAPRSVLKEIRPWERRFLLPQV